MLSCDICKKKIKANEECTSWGYTTESDFYYHKRCEDKQDEKYSLAVKEMRKRRWKNE